MRPSCASRARHVAIVVSATVVDQYQKPDQITPSRTSTAVGTAISQGRDGGESVCMLTPSPQSRSCVAPFRLLAKRASSPHCNLPFMHVSESPANQDLWVFGYGSLMWRPDFVYLERVPARLIGLHRALCVYSFVHRGTPEKPGLVLGLDRGGACRGIAYRVAAANRDAIVAYLREREQVTSVYLETWRRITLATTPPRDVTALVFLVDRSHPQYAGRLDLERQIHLVRQGHGRSGANRDYVLSTARSEERR